MSAIKYHKDASCALGASRAVLVGRPHSFGSAGVGDSSVALVAGFHEASVRMLLEGGVDVTAIGSTVLELLADSDPPG